MAVRLGEIGHKKYKLSICNWLMDDVINNILIIRYQQSQWRARKARFILGVKLESIIKIMTFGLSSVIMSTI